MRPIALLLLLLSVIAKADPSYISFPSDITWNTKTSDHFQIVFREGSDTFAIRVLKAAEKAHELLTPIFPETPDKTWILLADFRDSLNGYSLNMPYSHFVIFATPPEANSQLASLDDWLASVVLHEYVHTLHLYPAHGLWKLMRTLFGTWVLPNGMMPSHFHEGMATFLETELKRGGRGRSPSFKMYRRKAVESGSWGNEFVSLDLMDGSRTRWPFGVSPYFFGYTLTQELWSRKGKKGIYDLTQSYSSNWPYFINTPLKEVYGLSYDELWKDIYTKTRAETQKEIDLIKKTPLSPLRYWTSNRFNKWNLSLSPDGQEFVIGAATPKDNAHIELWNVKSQKAVHLPISGDGPFEDLCWQASGQQKKILYLSSTGEEGYLTYELFEYNFATQESKAITLNKETLIHIRRLHCDSETKSALLYQEWKGVGRILEVKLSSSNNEVTLVRQWQIPEGSWVTGLLSGPSKWIALREGLNTHLLLWNEENTPKKMATLPAEIFNLRNSDASNTLNAISDIDGRHEIWEFDLNRQSMRKRVALLGGAESFDSVGTSWFVASYEHGGYDLASTQPIASPSRKIPSVSVSSLASQPTTNYSENIQQSETRSYSPFGTLYPHTWIPSVFFVPSGAQIGAWLPGFDLTQKHFYNIFGGYDTRGLAFANVDYSYRFGGHYAFDTSANLSPSYLQSTKSFFKRWGGRVGFGGKVWSPIPYVHLSLIFSRLESSYLGPAQQSIGVGVDLSKSFGFPTKKLSISPVNGVKLTVSHSQYFKSMGSSSNYFSSIAQVDNYLEAPWWNDSVFYLSGKLGYTEGTTFINSYFEGGGELLFYQSRGFFRNRGFVPGIFAGRRMFAANAEYRFPISRVDRGIGLWPMHLEVIHGALVADTTSYDVGVQSGRTPQLFKTFHTSCGLELKSDWKFFYYLPTQIRIGAYHGFGPLGESAYFTMGVEAGL